VEPTESPPAAGRPSVAAFYAARLDEDEVAAVRAQALRDKLDDPHREIDHGIRDGAEYAWREVAANPARVLREVEAGRAILAAWQEAEAERKPFEPEYAYGICDGRADALLLAVQGRAAVWRDHPAFDPRWLP
jgi:Family of unknown function (DUF6221)